ncbi:MAG: NAD(P)-dependent oxidoreductase [bacterium]
MNILRLSWSSYQTDDSLQHEAETIRSQGHRYLRPRRSGPRPGKLKTYDVIIINSQFEVDEVFLNHWNNDGLILTASNGYDHIDLDACSRYGVLVGRTPDCRAKSVSAYVKNILGVFKCDLHRTGHPVRNTFWDRPASFQNIQSMKNLTLGIVGFGAIGEKLLETIDVSQFESVLINDPLKEEKIQGHPDTAYATPRELVESSNILSLHADLNPSTRGLITRRTLDALPDPSFLINTARGSMVEPDAVRSALTDDSLNGAVLDVLPEEPPENSDVLRDEGLFVTPHSAGFSPTLTEDMTDELVSNLETYEETGEPSDPLTPRSSEELDRLKAQWDDLD